MEQNPYYRPRSEHLVQADFSLNEQSGVFRQLKNISMPLKYREHSREAGQHFILDSGVGHTDLTAADFHLLASPDLGAQNQGQQLRTAANPKAGHSCSHGICEVTELRSEEIVPLQIVR
jgi:hypothetical protein